MAVAGRGRTRASTAPAAGARAFAPVTATMNALRRIVHALHASNVRATGRFDVTTAQLFVLREIARVPDASYAQLAQATRTAQSSLSEAVGRLIEKGLVARRVSDVDARRARLVVTARGLLVASQPQDTVQERLIRGLERLSADQQVELARALEAWIAASGLSDESPEMFFEGSRSV